MEETNFRDYVEKYLELVSSDGLMRIDQALEASPSGKIAVKLSTGEPGSNYLRTDILYINVMNRLSVDCDCDGSPAEPDMHDIGVLASYDLVAFDQACVDLVYGAEDGKSLIDRIEPRNGLHTLEQIFQYCVLGMVLGIMGIVAASALGIASPLCMYNGAFCFYIIGQRRSWEKLLRNWNKEGKSGVQDKQKDRRPDQRDRSGNKLYCRDGGKRGAPWMPS